MSRPLWQIFLTLFAVGFTLQRGAMTYLFLAFDDGGGAALAAAYAIQTLAGAATAAGLWAGRLWVLGVLIVLGVSVAGSAILSSFFLGIRPPMLAVPQVLIAALATGALFLVLRREFRGGGPSPMA